MKKFSASIISMNPFEIKENIKILEGNIDFLHFDIMDGIFVNRYGLYPEILGEIKKNTTLPVCIHAMANNHEQYIETFAKYNADYYIFNIETTNHVDRVVNKIKSYNMIPGIALNPATSLSTLDYIINNINFICLMAINPGIPGHKFISYIYEKIKDLRKRFKNIIIEIDGGITFENARLVFDAGADILVCGSGTIFQNNGITLLDNIIKLKKIINE